MSAAGTSRFAACVPAGWMAPARSARLALALAPETVALEVRCTSPRSTLARLHGVHLMGEQNSGARGEAESPLHGAAWCNESRRIRRLVSRGHDVNVRDEIGETPLHGAAAWGNRTAVRTLLKLDARHDLVSTDGMTALHWAAGWGNLGVVRALVRAGADTKIRDAHGRTPAQLAASRGKAKVAAWLAAQGA